MSTAAIEEEQEILQSIYPDEFERLNADTFKVRVDLDAEACRTKRPPIVYLIARLGPSYPDEAPHLSLETTIAEDDEPTDDDDNDSSRPEDLTSDDKNTILEALAEEAQESLGMAMIFTLTSALKDRAEQCFAAHQAQREQAKQAEQAALERQERKKFEGTAVTAASFAAWQATFLAEQRKAAREAEEQLLKRAGPGAAARKLTGREMFEGDKTLAASDAALLGDDVEFDFSKFDKTVQLYPDDEPEERRF